MIKRCIIITAFLDCDISEVYTKQDGDYIICADGGIEVAKESGIIPNVVIGDLDSVDNVDSVFEFHRFPKEKDDTDTLLCLKYGLELGYRSFIIIGGIGGRFDHTFANIQTVAYAKNQGADAHLYSYDTCCRMIENGESIVIPKKEGFYLSVFSYSDICEGVLLRGTKYELENGVLTHNFPLGVSNEFKDDFAQISISKGRLLIILSKE